MQLPTALDRTSSGVRRTFSALHSPNYRLWFAGQLVSLVGTWMQNTAQGYLVYELTKSPVFLGYVGFAAGVPAWAFTLFGGVIADRVPRRTMLLATQSAMMVLAFVLTGLVFSQRVQPWHIVVLALGLGTATAFDAPARQAFVVELVDRKDLTNAIALNSAMFNLATVIGPTVAAVVYAALGPAWCFAVNGISFVAVIVALFLIKVDSPPPRRRQTSAATDLKQGLRYTAANPVIRTLILNMGIISLFGVSIVVLLPAWSVDLLGGDVGTNGLLLSARGLGALIGALMIAMLSHRPLRGRLWSLGSLLLPVTLVAFALSRWLPLSLLAMVATGWSFMVQANTSNALVQGGVDDDLRGRVMSLFTLTFFGAMPLGSLWAGSLAHWLGAPVAVLLSASIVALAAAWIRLRLPFIRRLA